MYTDPAPPPERVSLKATQPQVSPSNAVTPSAAGPLAALPVELRWGIETDQQRSVWLMHERCFPAKYDTKFYIDLFAAKEECAFLSLCAYTTPSAYVAAARAHRRAFSDAIATPITEQAEDDILSKLTPTEQVEYSRPPMPPPPSHSAAAVEEDMKRQADISELLLQLEYIAKRRATTAPTGATAKQPVNGVGDDGAEEFSVLIGFSIGMFGYARQSQPSRAAADDESPSSTAAPPRRGPAVILSNPSGYLGSLAVDEHVRNHGVGGVLLERFLHYMTTQLPVRASSYLHYTREGMLALLRRTRPDLFRVEKDHDALKAKLEAERQRQELDRIAAECGMVPAGTANDAAAPARASPSLWQLACQLCPPLFNLYEDRCARRVLREKHHLSEAGITEARLLVKNGINWRQGRDFADRARVEMAALAPELDPVMQHGVAEVWLHCNATDTAVTAFYLKRGFRLHAVIPNFYELDHVKTAGNLLLFERTRNTTAAADDGAARKETGDEDDVLGRLSRMDAARSAQAPAATGPPSHSPDAATDAATDAAIHKKDDDAAKPADVADASPPVLRRWLVPGEYGRVVDVATMPVHECRRLYQKQSGAGRGNGGKSSRRQATMDWWKELGLLINALALLVYVCVMSYRFSKTGKLW